MVLRHSFLSLVLLQHSASSFATAFSTPSYSASSATAISFGDLNNLHGFLPALSPAQIPIAEIWTPTAENITISLPENPKSDKNEGHNQDSSTDEVIAPIDEEEQISARITQPTSQARTEKSYDLSSVFNKRDGVCGTQYTACSAQGFPGFCCTTVAACSKDYYGSIACCPYGAVCTGSVASGVQQTSTTQSTIRSTSVTTTTTGVSQQSVTTTTAGSATTASAGFIQVSGLTVATVGSTTGAAFRSMCISWQILILGLATTLIQSVMS